MKRYCCVRIDDVCPTMDYANFQKAMDLLRKYNIYPLLGVIPDNQDSDQFIDSEKPDFWGMIRTLQKEGCLIAMHGFHHVYNQESPKTMLCGRKHSEFAGNDYETQLELIDKGKRTLLSHGIETDIFFAPAHSFDSVTLKALRDNGFKYNSDGLSCLPYSKSGIVNIPCRSAGVPRKLSGIVNVAVIHPSEWSRPEKAGGLQQLATFCAKNEENLCSFSVLLSIRRIPYFLGCVSEIMFKMRRLFKDIIRRVYRMFFRKKARH